MDRNEQRGGKFAYQWLVMDNEGGDWVVGGENGNQSLE